MQTWVMKSLMELACLLSAVVVVASDPHADLITMVIGLISIVVFFAATCWRWTRRSHWETCMLHVEKQRGCVSDSHRCAR